MNNELGSITFQYPEVEDRTISRQLSSFKGLPPEEARKHAKKIFPGFAGKTNNEDSVKHTTDYINNFEELKQLEAFFKNILNKDHIETCQFCGVPVVDKTITNCPCW